MEHRWGQRVPVGARVRLSCLPYAIGAGAMRDVSVSGAFLETRLRIPLLALINVEIEHPAPNRARRLSAAGHVVRHDPEGVGIEWLELAPLAVGELLQLCAVEALAEGNVHSALHMRGVSDSIFHAEG